MAADPIAATVRKETEVLIGKLVMQNTTLTAQVNALTAGMELTQKELEAARKALADTQSEHENTRAALADALKAHETPRRRT